MEIQKIIRVIQK